MNVAALAERSYLKTSVRSANQEREALPVISYEKGALSIARRRKR
jgi:hypothetical protein